MSAENLLVVPMDVPIKPFARMRRAYWPKKGENVMDIPERYSHTLLLRRRISLHSIEGRVDIISENPEAMAQMLVNNGRFQVEKPFGDVIFKGVFREGNTFQDMEYDEIPYILRFGFPLRSPSEYARLLNTYVDVKLNKEKYMAAWNLSAPAVARRMQSLEEGNPVIVREKNLFNLKDIGEVEIESDAEGNADFGRITFVWLAADAKKFRGIELTFHQFFDGDYEEPTIPILPERELVIARS
ncbi:MAG: hypothetical protein AAB414_03430 [Patescibacteria group bacterium]